MVFGSFARGPLIGTPLVNAGQDFATVMTGTPTTSKQTGKAPHQTGYDPLESTWDALTEWPVTSDIVEVTTEVVQVVADLAEEVWDAVKEIATFAEDAAKAAGKLISDSANFASWILEHPLLIIGTVGVVAVVVLAIALK